MIIKLRTVDEGWSFHSIKDGFKVRELTIVQFENGIKFNTPWVNEINLDIRPFKPYVININNGPIIYTNLPTYLLNDSGKTIETLVN